MSTEARLWTAVLASDALVRRPTERGLYVGGTSDTLREHVGGLKIWRRLGVLLDFAPEM